MLQFLLLYAGEEKAPLILRIYDNFHNDMLAVARSKLRNRGSRNYDIDYEDVVQQVYQRITNYCKMEALEWDDNHLRGYLFTMISNIISDMRKENVIYSFDEERYANVPEDEFLRRVAIKDNYERIVKIAEEMNELYAYTLVMRYYHNKEVREIAEFMGVSEKAVYSRLERGRVKLLAILEREGITYE